MEEEMEKGKKFNENGELIFDGEYLKGKKWTGKKNKINFNFKVEIEYLNGKKWNGKGINLKTKKIMK